MGNTGPDVWLRAEASGSGQPKAIMGDTLRTGSAQFDAAVLNVDQARDERPGMYSLSVIRDGEPYLVCSIPVGEDEFHLEFDAPELGRCRLQIDRTLAGVASIEAVSNPIYLLPH